MLGVSRPESPRPLLGTKSPVNDKYPWALWQRLIMISTAFFASITMSGVTIGHIAFRELLLSSKDYLCTAPSLMHVGKECFEYETRLNGSFFISSVVLKLAAYPLGRLMDQFGARITSMLGCAIFASGTLMLGFSDLSLGWLHHIGYCVMAVGGMCVYMPSLQLCRILPKMSGLMMALMTGAFEASSVIFFALSRFYLWTSPRFTPNQLLVYYTIIPLIAFILVTSFYPDGEIPITYCRRNLEWEQPEREITPPKTMDKVLSSPDFWLLGLFTGAITTRFTIYLSTLTLRISRSALTWREQRAILSEFGAFLPLGGIISMPAVGQLLSSFSLSTNTFILWIAIVCFWEPVIAIRSRDAQTYSILLGTLLKPYFFAVFNQLCERLFGHVNMGRVHGLLMLIAGLMNLTCIAVAYDNEFLRFWPLIQVGKMVRFGLKVSVILSFYLYRRGI